MLIQNRTQVQLINNELDSASDSLEALPHFVSFLFGQRVGRDYPNCDARGEAGHEGIEQPYHGYCLRGLRSFKSNIEAGRGQQKTTSRKCCGLTKLDHPPED